MALHYILDGYNLLYALRDIPSGSLENKREALLNLILRMKPYGKNSATVVFDSREGGGSRTSRAELQIVYTSGETADDWISHHVRETPNPRIVMVVTNDQGLRRLIRGTGAKTIGADEFWALAKTVSKPQAERPPTEGAEDITEEFKKKWL